MSEQHSQERHVGGSNANLDQQSGIDECGSLIEAAVKKWLPKRKKLAKGKKNRTSNDASVPVAQVSLPLGGTSR